MKITAFSGISLGRGNDCVKWTCSDQYPVLYNSISNLPNSLVISFFSPLLAFYLPFCWWWWYGCVNHALCFSDHDFSRGNLYKQILPNHL